ncbi:hypothetical protein GCM10010317_098110 [Streptomyces mirabilis]|uniref:hypothetical protein n=1 Tax=Streptomyces mirabilis TaxID=68239 RepID=UPI00167DBB63|nr:hypothetical protein [Streptomyces mirabilis]GHD78579.1 hypothetical protein GCM10010317_098110 [Streptomyces mirabilis]
MSDVDEGFGLAVDVAEAAGERAFDEVDAVVCDSTGRGGRKTAVGRPVVLPPGVLSGVFPAAEVPVRCGAGPV